MSEATLNTLPSADDRRATAALLAGQDLIITLPLRALAITGADALTFLQGQVTTDMREVSAGESRLGCLLNLKGRIQVSFRVVAIDDGYLLIMPADQIEPARARLGKYAVFSKVTLAERPLTITGVLGEQARQRLQDAGWQWPAAVNGVSPHEHGLLVRLPGQARALRLTTASAPAPAPAATELAAWDCASVAAGELLLPAAASERYQPQEIDYHQLHGVSYQKGCYLGQEIVARLYFRGQLKTALTRLSMDIPSDSSLAVPQPGQDIVSDGRSVGEVISLAWPDEQRLEMLALVRQDAGELAIAGADGTLLALSPLPFAR